MQENIHIISFIIYWIVFLITNIKKKHKKNELENDILKNIIPSTIIFLNMIIVGHSLFMLISEYIDNKGIWR